MTSTMAFKRFIIASYPYSWCGLGSSQDVYIPAIPHPPYCGFSGCQPFNSCSPASFISAPVCLRGGNGGPSSAPAAPGGGTVFRKVIARGPCGVARVLRGGCGGSASCATRDAAVLRRGGGGNGMLFAAVEEALFTRRGSGGGGAGFGEVADWLLPERSNVGLVGLGGAGLRRVWRRAGGGMSVVPSRFF